MPKAPREDEIVLDGTVVEALPNAMFRVSFNDTHEALAYLGGKLRTHRIRVLPGDKVRVALSAYDLKRGRLVYRYPTN